MTLALGFGTGAIMGRVSRRQGLAALERAYAAGIRHFDTARSYGWGEAESVVGEFLRGHPREEIRLVTKCGILPVRRSPILSAAKSIARTVLTVAPGLRHAARQVASAERFQPVRSADPAMLAESLRTSLAELGTDHVDLLLLHNFAPGMTGLNEVAAWFADLKKQGKVRRFGYSVEGALTEGLDFLAGKGLVDGAVIQAPVSEELLALPARWRDVPFIVHAPFEYLRRAPGQNFANLLGQLDGALNCEAVVCSMFDAAHLQANVAAWEDVVRVARA